jgi:hypothetical protein
MALQNRRLARAKEGGHTGSIRRLEEVRQYTHGYLSHRNDKAIVCLASNSDATGYFGMRPSTGLLRPERCCDAEPSHQFLIAL